MKSFLFESKYFSRVFIVFILLDFFMRRVFVFDYTWRVIDFVAIFIRIILTIILISLFFYRTYEFIFTFEKPYIKIPFVFSGIFFIILSIVLFYIRTYNAIYYIFLSLLIFFMFVLYLCLFYMTFKRSSNENYRAISVFSLVASMALVIKSFISSISILPFISAYNYFTEYLSRLSAYAILILMLYVSFYFLQKVKILNFNPLYIKIIFVLIALILTFTVYISQNEIIVINILGSLSMPLTIPSVIFLFAFTLFFISFLTMIFLYQYENMFCIAASLFILSGLSGVDIYLRLLSLFAAVEMFIISGYNSETLQETNIYGIK